MVTGIKWSIVLPGYVREVKDVLFCMMAKKYWISGIWEDLTKNRSYVKLRKIGNVAKRRLEVKEWTMNELFTMEMRF